ncbi:MAG TPA: dihydrofolate reductase family protein [Chloroflexota bacterium]|nr:dihydrofolate reductase family protein [Chloroflexota bacterium]
MRKISAGLYITLDGVVEAPEQWTGPYFDAELGQAVGSILGANDTMLLGRVTYEGFAAAFAGQTGGVADVMNNTSKVVVSTTLKTADWQNSTLISGDVVQAITTLTQQPGKNIGIGGSPTLVRWLLRQGLLDELSLFVFPIVLGKGKRLFEDGGDPLSLKLMDSKTFSTGVVSLTYGPAGA